MDDFLKERLIKYNTWLDRGQISFSSKIIPTRESLSARKWVLPSEQVLNILRNAQSIAVQKCGCRVHYSRCDKPLEVCFLLDETGEHSIAKGRARPVSLSEAADIIRKADEYGLIHLTLYHPDHEIYALCNSCPCCCHDLQLMKEFNRRDLVVRSEYVAVTDKGSCINCDKCVFLMPGPLMTAGCSTIPVYVWAVDFVSRFARSMRLLCINGIPDTKREVFKIYRSVGCER